MKSLSLSHMSRFAIQEWMLKYNLKNLFVAEIHALKMNLKVSSSRNEIGMADVLLAVAYLKAGAFLVASRYLDEAQSHGAFFLNQELLNVVSELRSVILGRGAVEEARPRLSGKLEKIVLAALETQRSRVELVELVFGNQLPFETAENRLKNLLHRIRKKLPGLIAQQHGYYVRTDCMPKKTA
ncbi:MAG: hypothetical protein A2428_08570 [Bdellovibrionales bacterium RIFOXYC1_FULL_54_43]|nr:MAG: hypothetical protein A2428_08570 [Bdellovibrionales bacterium RIFOXYC1_FULL_54_43]OFZ84271.1 MAG: hypothetical protein A2603_15150 [Bdellovibrionales bacterium RIFOXYD1_FULL_55_31]